MRVLVSGSGPGAQAELGRASYRGHIGTGVRHNGRVRRVLPLLAASVVVLGARCADVVPERFDAVLIVVDEQGLPLPTASAELPASRAEADVDGAIELDQLRGPEVALVTAPGFLVEPVPVGWGDADKPLRVRLLRAEGRVTMHFGGDFMLGRRYESPESGEPLLRGGHRGADAREVVRHLGRAFAAADHSTLNLETVVSSLGLDTAYPGKRFLLNTHPDSLSALDELGVDLVVLANNHARDWLDVGVEQTVAALDAVGIPWVGGGGSAEQAELPRIQQVGELSVGTLSFTTVTGSFVNDSYPPLGEEPADSTPDSELWMYDTRPWGFSNTEWTVGQDERRVREVWDIFSAAEGDLSQDTASAAWASGVEVYPELQDWVARRAHGGAAWWRTATGTERIAALAQQVDLCVVQLHSGFQFQAAPSTTVAAAARAAIDAGADVVIAHHPHVLQGFELYKGHLIAYSMGNLVFDQDFLDTFPTGFLRTVWEGDVLLQARFVPLELAGYRPVVTTDEAARRTLRRVWERSITPARTSRSPVDGAVYALRTELDADTEPLHVAVEHNTGRLLTEPCAVQVELSLEPDTPQRLDPLHLSPGRLGLASGEQPHIEVGRELFGWGRFEDEVADGRAVLSTHWALNSDDERASLAAAASGRGKLSLRRDDRNESAVTTRPVARVPLPRHRLYADIEGALPVPLDSPASYQLRLKVRQLGDGEASVRLDMYRFVDTDPTVDPHSSLLGRLERRLPPSEEWQEFAVDFNLADVTSRDDVNMLLINLLLEPPTHSDETLLYVDDIELIEWRQASVAPDLPAAYTHVRSRGQPAELSFEALSADLGCRE